MRNELDKETSPYLLQHADNPVHWRAWGEAALNEARETGKPILLSVGYAACHWCHVMAHESFENPAIAELMNKLFVNIKVDREERPDIDAVYQHALALMGEQGGWPLTMFLTPDGGPFWGGTYFPPEPKFGRPGLPGLLIKVAEVYREKADVVAENVAVLREALRKSAEAEPGEPIAHDIADRLAAELLKQFDPAGGGLGHAPKFPHVPIYALVLRSSLRTGDPAGRDAVLHALTRMCQGGIYDHLGGGFARYSTDAMWLVPHFEKMLYDNAQLIEILLFAHRLSGDPLFAERIAETADWAIREMTAEGGAFAGTLDADSEGEEGKFYVWTEDEIDAVLGEDAGLFRSVYGVTAQGNFEGRNILNRLASPEHLDGETEDRLADARARLFAARGARVRPGRDDKILADWNALLIAALARAGLAFDRADWIEAAARAFDFIRGPMAEAAGGGDRLAHSYRAGRASSAGMLDDYAAMARAAIVLFETLGRDRYLDDARALVAVLERDFSDGAGGFFFTANDASDLIVRTRSADDGPTPAGNAMAVEAYARLWLLTGKDEFRRRAEALIRAFSGGLKRNAFGLASLINAAELLSHAAQTVIVGARGTPATDSLIRAAVTAPAPNLVLQVVRPGAQLPHGHPAADKVSNIKSASDTPRAYVCVGPVCSLPATDPESLQDVLTRA